MTGPDGVSSRWFALRRRLQQLVAHSRQLDVTSRYKPLLDVTGQAWGAHSRQLDVRRPKSISAWARNVRNVCDRLWSRVARDDAVTRVVPPSLRLTRDGRRSFYAAR